MLYQVYLDGDDSTLRTVDAPSPAKAAEAWAKKRYHYRIGEVLHVVVVPPGGSFPDDRSNGDCYSFQIRVKRVILEHVGT